MIFNDFILIFIYFGFNRTGGRLENQILKVNLMIYNYRIYFLTEQYDFNTLKRVQY